MKLRRIKLAVPRHKRGENQRILITALPEECEKPVRKVLVDILARLYNNERKVNATQ